MAAAGIAGVALVIGEVLVACVSQRDPVALIASGHVPAHEIGGIAHPVPLGATPPGGFAILVPGAVQGLAVAIGAAPPAHGNHPQDIAERRARIGAVFAFLVNDRHLNMGRHAPFSFGRAEGAFVLRALRQNAAGVVQIARRRLVAAATGRQNQD